MRYSIPSEMQALEIPKLYKDINEAVSSLKVVSKLVPHPKHGQVLVKIEAAPCNPSDLLFIQGRYNIQKKFPTTPGWEGAGTVVASGGGLYANFLVGKRVACSGILSGTWSQYCLSDASSCIPLKPSISFEQGATLLINPFSAYGMLEKAKNEGHAAIVQTAAASQLGRILLTLADEENIPVINIVRRVEQEDLLLKSGAKFVLNSENPLFLDLLKQYSHDLKATIAFDAVAGQMTGTLFTALPPNSTVVVYGTLSMSPCEIATRQLIGENKKLEGFLLSNWVRSHNLWSLYRASTYLQGLMGQGRLKTTIRKTVNLNEAPNAILEYQKEMTSGKIIICPQN